MDIDEASSDKEGGNDDDHSMDVDKEPDEGPVIAKDSASLKVVETSEAEDEDDSDNEPTTKMLVDLNSDFVRLPSNLPLKDTIGRLPSKPRKRCLSKGKKKQDIPQEPLEDEEQGQPIAMQGPLASSSSNQDKEAEFEYLLSEASKIVKSNSENTTDLESSDAILFLAAVLALTKEDRKTFLDLEHKDMVEGFRELVGKKRREDDPNSPEHKRARHH